MAVLLKDAPNRSTGATGHSPMAPERLLSRGVSTATLSRGISLTLVSVIRSIAVAKGGLGNFCRAAPRGLFLSLVHGRGRVAEHQNLIQILFVYTGIANSGFRNCNYWEK